MERAIFINRDKAVSLAQRIGVKLDCTVKVYPVSKRGAIAGYGMTVLMQDKTVHVTESML
jgi:hypothetical protein